MRHIYRMYYIRPHIHCFAEWGFIIKTLEGLLDSEGCDEYTAFAQADNRTLSEWVL